MILLLFFCSSCQANTTIVKQINVFLSMFCQKLAKTNCSHMTMLQLAIKVSDLPRAQNPIMWLQGIVHLSELWNQVISSFWQVHHNFKWARAPGHKSRTMSIFCTDFVTTEIFLNNYFHFFKYKIYSYFLKL